MSGAGTLGLESSSTYDLSGGMASNYSYTKVKKNQLKRLLNANLLNDGDAQTRGGRSKINTTALGSNNTVRGLHTLAQTTGADKVLATCNGDVNEISTGANILVKSGLSALVKPSAVMNQDYLFYCNGANTPFMTKGAAATTYQVGISAAPNIVGFTAAPAAGGNGTDGLHRIAFRYRSTITGARSNPVFSGTTISSTSLTLAAGNETYAITFPVGLVSADAQVDTIDYFAQEAAAAADSPYYFLGSSANANGVYSFGTAVSDAELVLKERLDIDDNVADAQFRFFEVWRDRTLALSGDYGMRFSKIKFDLNGVTVLPTSFPATNELFIGKGDGFKSLALVKLRDYVIAMKGNGFFILLGDFDSGSFEFRRLTSNSPNVGLLNPTAFTVVGDRLYFVSQDLKFYYMSMTDFDDTQLRVPIVPISDPIADNLSTIAPALRGEVNLVNFTPGEGQFTQVWTCFSDGSTGFQADQNFNTLVFDYTKEAWHIHTGLEVSCSTIARDSNGDAYVATGDYYGYVWKQNDTTYDGAAINGTSTGANGANTLNDTTQAFVASQIGTFVSIIGGTGEGQIRRVTGVPSGTQLQVTPAWAIVPDNTSAYTDGGIDFEVWSRDDWLEDRLPPDCEKQGWYLDIDLETDGEYEVDVNFIINRNQNLQSVLSRVVGGVMGALWGFEFWGFGIWGAKTTTTAQVGFDLLFSQISHIISKKEAGQPVRVKGWTYYFQNLMKLRPF